MNVTQHIFERLEQYGARPVFGTATADVTGDEFARLVRERAKALSASIQAGDPVLVFNMRGMDFWVDTLAVWWLGGVTVPVPVSTDSTSFATILKVSKPKGFLGDPGNLEDEVVGLEACKEGGSGGTAGASGGARLASINFTSGSTGEPKGVLLTHEAILANCLGTVDSLGIEPTDRVIVPIPFNFISAVSHFLVCMTAGACTIATESKLMQRDLGDLFKKARANALGGAPLHLRWVSELCEQTPIPVRWLMASGDHLGIDVIEALDRLVPDARVLVVYGLTEVGGRCCVLDRKKVRALHPDKPNALIDSVGTPIRGLKIEVLDDDGTAVPEGEIGELVLSGTTIFQGYLNNPEATQSVLRGGRFHTRDMGRVDADGNVYVMGRKDDVFKSSGLKVATVPIADALMDIGVFADVAVRPKESLVAGHVAEALYVLRAGQTFQKGEVISELRKRLPLHWIPQHFTEVAEIPRTGSGKISRRHLKDIHTDEAKKL